MKIHIVVACILILSTLTQTQAQNMNQMGKCNYALHITPLTIEFLFDRELDEGLIKMIGDEFSGKSEREDKLEFFQFHQARSEGVVIFKRTIEWDKNVNVALAKSYAQRMASILAPGCQPKNTELKYKTTSKLHIDDY